MNLSCAFQEELIPIQFKLSHVEEEEQPPKEEVVMSIGDDAGAKPVEPIEQWKRTEGLCSEIAVAGEESAVEMEVPPSILLRPDRERNNSQRVCFSAISTVQPFKKRSSPANLSTCSLLPCHRPQVYTYYYAMSEKSYCLLCLDDASAADFVLWLFAMSP